MNYKSIIIILFICCFSSACKVEEKKETIEKIDLLINENPCTKEELLDEIKGKTIRVIQWLQEKQLDGVLLSTTRNFSWITAGIGDNHIAITSETGPASLLIMKNGKKYVVGDNAEIPHLMDEDLNGLGYEPLSYLWNEDKKLSLVREIAGSGKIGSDVLIEGLLYVESDFAPLRYQFTSSEIKKYKWLNHYAAEAVASVCRTITPGMTDKYVEALTSNELMKRGIRPTVVLIGFDDRIAKYCHFPPVGKKLEKYAFVNVCARKWGMVTSVGRYVYFGELPENLQKAVHASAEICANMIHHTRPGYTSEQMFDSLKGWYAQTGYPAEWKNIHSGGCIGYLEREWVAGGETNYLFKSPQAFAWNPFTTGTLSFHTIISTDEGNEILTQIENWPVISVEIEGHIYEMPDILVK